MCHTAEATLDVLIPVFEDRIISRRADVVWSPRGCDLTPLDYYLWGAVKDKCYADKLETIFTLKDNIREAIGKIHNRYFLKHFPKKKVFVGSYILNIAYKPFFNNHGSKMILYTLNE